MNAPLTRLQHSGNIRATLGRVTRRSLRFYRSDSQYTSVSASAPACVLSPEMRTRWGRTVFGRRAATTGNAQAVLEHPWAWAGHPKAVPTVVQFSTFTPLTRDWDALIQQAKACDLNLYDLRAATGGSIRQVSLRGDCLRDVTLWHEDGTTYVATDNRLTPERSAALATLALQALCLGRFACDGVMNG